MTEEEKETYQELQIEKINNQLHAKEIFQNFQLPRWRSLPEDLRQVFKIAAAGNSADAVAVSCNFGPRAAERAAKASRGAADYAGRKMRGIPGLSPEIAAVLEDAAHRQGCNPGLHFHAAFRVPADQVTLLKTALVNLFASDYVEVAGNQAVLIKPISHPGRWASYCCKTLRRADRVEGHASFATNDASRAGEQLYNKVMDWLRQLPSLEQLQAEIDGLVRPHIKSKPCPELFRMIIQHAERKKAAQHRRGQQTKHYKRLVANNPEQFRYELVEIFTAASAAVNMPDITLTELAGGAISEQCNKGTPASPDTFTERYRGLPGVGEWATVDEDDEPLFGHHPDPES
ncbi:TPA: hypothetical protein NZK13_003954 [Pseudomonas aeruginosa]|nr:hypothetical protein [Pseudomonas aeruginosa]HCK3356070.1 hypothetical protein [Pseudomonas aeruginosa]